MRLITVVAVLGFSSGAEAFCGFYVSGAGGKLFNDASMVVLLRDGTRTVLSMQNNYRGPAEDFALVVPVPVVLQKGNVTTLPREAFERLDELTAPRLVEVPKEPCGLGLAGIGVGGGGVMNMAAGSGMARDLGVKVEAKFDVEEYEIVILSAQDSMGLEIWLKEEKYRVPDGAAALLKPYVQAGSKFFVAKVNAKKVKLKGGEMVLSPLRFHYDAEAFTLPVRLGLVNSEGTQDLIVHVIAKQRYELANFKNVLVPTNFDVRTRTQPQWGGFYKELLSRTFARNPGAAITEFAWEGALPPPVEQVGGGTYGVTCDPCPPPHPVDNPLAKYLGVLMLPKIKTDTGIAEFARAATVTRLHLRFSKESPPDDLVFKAAEPISGGVPEVKVPGPAKANRFQGRYVMWTTGCGGLGLGFFSGGSSLNKPMAGAVDKLVDPFEQLIVEDLPALGVKAVPLSKDAPKLEPYRPAPPPPPPPAPSPLSFPPPVVGSGLDAEYVKKVVFAHRAQLQFCFERRQATVPVAQGRFLLEWEVSETGAVTSSSVSSGLDPEVAACVASRPKMWTFPKPKGGAAVTVKQVIVFTPLR